MTDREQNRIKFSKVEAQRHVKALQDQADVVFKPEGFEVLHTINEQGDEDFLVTFQRDWESAVGSVVVLFDRQDMENWIAVAREVLDTSPLPE